MRHLFGIVLILAGSPIGQSQRGVDLAQQERAALLRIHRADREAHFKADVNLLQAHSPEEFITVSRGRIHRPTRSDERKMFTDYFRGAKYFEWDDVEEPIIRVSRDGSMAWMITRVRVRRTQADAAGKEVEEKFVYAGIMTYEKRDGRWVRVANVSTFEPPN